MVNNFRQPMELIFLITNAFSGVVMKAASAQAAPRIKESYQAAAVSAAEIRRAVNHPARGAVTVHTAGEE